MPERLTVPVALLATALLVGLLVVLPANAQPRFPVADELKACVDRTGHLSMLFLVDESSSLFGDDGTDPDARRVGGLQRLINALARAADGEDAPRIDVLMTGFAGGLVTAPSFDPEVTDPFVTVEAGVVAQLRDTAEAFAERDPQGETNYAAALAGARTLLAGHAADVTSGGGPAPCGVVVFFTDGQIFLSAGPEAIAASVQELCRSGGIADQLRDDGVAILALALDTNLSPEALELLQSIAVGPDCGTTGSDRTGLFIPVGDARQLAFAFGLILQSTQGEVIAPPAPPSGSFEVVPGISGFLISGEPAEDGEPLDLELTPPGGSPITLPAEQPAEVAGVPMEVTAIFGGGLEADADVPAGIGAWTGRWTYQFTRADGSTPAVFHSVRLFTDLDILLDGNQTFTPGEPSAFRFTLVDGAGTPADSSLVQDASLAARVTDGQSSDDLDVTASSPGVFQASWRAPQDPGRQNRTLEALVTFSPDASAAIEELSRSWPLQLLLPAYPAVMPASLQLPSVENTGSTSGELTITGSPDGGGCVWFSPGPLTAGETTPPTLTLDPPAIDQASCVRVDAGGTATVVVTYEVTDAADGQVRQELAATLRSDAVNEDVIVGVPVSFQQRRPVDAGLRFWIFVGLLLFLLLLPLLLLAALNWVIATLAPPNLIRYAERPVRVGLAGLTGPDGQPITLGWEDFTPLTQSAATRVRRVGVGPVRVRTRWARRWWDLRWVFEGPVALATAGRSPIITGWHGGDGGGPDATEAEVPLWLDGTWVYIDHGPERLGDEETRGTLLVLTRAGGGLDQHERTVIKASAALPSRRATLLAASRTPAPASSGAAGPSVTDTSPPSLT